MGINSATKYVISVLQRYLDTSLNDISNARGYTFAQKSYSKWAATELISELEKQPDSPPLITIENFMEKMDRYSCLNSKTSYIFSVARDVSEYIVDMLITF